MQAGAAIDAAVIAIEEKPTLTLRRLFPFPSGAGSSIGIAEILDELAAEAQRRATVQANGSRPYVLLNMASTADGRASVAGRAGPIGDAADSELLHGLRTIADGLLVGAGTVRVERYSRVLRGEHDRAARAVRGLPPELRTLIVSASLHLDPQGVPLLNEPQAPITIVTQSAKSLAPLPAQIGYLRCEHDGKLDLATALQRMRSELRICTLLCEGGPHLAAQLLQAGLIDELFLCLAPKLASGEQHLRILAGEDLDPPREMELVSLHEHESSLFLRYRLGTRRLGGA